MKQMKKNSKQVGETVGSSVYILSGNLEVKDQKLPKNFGLFYLYVDSRIVSIQENQVSSISSNEPTIFAREIKELTKQCNDKQILTIISSQEPNSNDNEKVVHVENIKVVRRNGKRALKMTASVEELEASGKYAENSINLDVPEGKVTLTCFWDQTYGCVG
jgi:hypothetical protein